jgi:hypothetical protein
MFPSKFKCVPRSNFVQQEHRCHGQGHPVCRCNTGPQFSSRQRRGGRSQAEQDSVPSRRAAELLQRACLGEQTQQQSLQANLTLVNNEG